jgi:hypothetical protein
LTEARAILPTGPRETAKTLQQDEPPAKRMLPARSNGPRAAANPNSAKEQGGASRGPPQKNSMKRQRETT